MGRLNISVGGGGGISSDEVTAVLSDVLKGTTALTSDSNDEIGEGTMLDKSGTSQAAEASLDTTNSRLQMNIPETGKYSTASKLYAAYSAIRTLIGLTAAKIISGNTILGLAGTATSDATISAASQLLKGVIAYGKNGVKYTGTIASLAAKTYTPGTSNQTIAAGQYLSGAQTIKGDSNLKAANIRMGVPIFGITGTFGGTIKSGETKLTNKGHVTFTNVNGTTRDLYAMELTGHGITPMMAAFWNDSYSVIWCRGWDSARVYYHANTNCVYVYHTNTTYYCMTSTSLVLPLPLTGTYQWAVCGY